MGVIRFKVAAQAESDDWEQNLQVYMSGLDGRVFPSRFERDGEMLVCRRQHADSGRFHISWPVKGFGSPMICTSSLRETETPYLLPLELARGKISQVRNQLSDWQIAGLQVPEEFGPIHHQAHVLFSRAISEKDDIERCVQHSNEAIECAFQAAHILTEAYAVQRQAERQQRVQRVPMSLGFGLGPVLPDAALTPKLTSAFNAAYVPLNWKSIEPTEGTYQWEELDAQVEWCLINKLLTYGGPLLDLSTGGLPDWLWTWQHDFLNLQSFVCDFVETAVSRYLGRIRLWEVSARGNTGGAMTLNEENRLALVARTLETARQIDDEVQLIIRVDQPWGAYQARGHHRLSALQFVDALHRSGVGITRINLEISIGYLPEGTASRDLLEFSRLIDLWSCLGLPLQVTLAFPTSTEADLEATGDLEVGPTTWKQEWSEAAQANWIREYLPVLLSKPAVLGVFWNHLSDALPHRFPHSGLIGVDGSPKEGLHVLTELRSNWKTS